MALSLSLSTFILFIFLKNFSASLTQATLFSYLAYHTTRLFLSSPPAKLKYRPFFSGLAHHVKLGTWLVCLWPAKMLISSSLFFFLLCWIQGKVLACLLMRLVCLCLVSLSEGGIAWKLDITRHLSHAYLLFSCLVCLFYNTSAMSVLHVLFFLLLLARTHHCRH